MNMFGSRSRLLSCALLTASALALSACSSLGSSGPSSASVLKANRQSVNSQPIQIIELTMPVALRVTESQQSSQFSEVLGEGLPVGTVIGRGDVLDIAVWEAPPAVLFGTLSGDVRIASAAAVARGSTMPEQMVDQNGQIRVPFAGQIMAAGRSPAQIEREIMSRLNGKAHEPQAIVRLVRNTTAAVTVVGDVASSTRVPLTPKGERLLDILSSAGGVKQPVGKTVIQVTRGARVISMPMEAVIKDPMQNVRLQADDVVTALFQPYSFTALGATSNNAEINFEATGLTLAQALGRVGGLRDERANVRGVFVFRMEDVRGVDPALLEGAQTTQDGKVPVIYRLNMSSPISFFVAQGFQMRNKDILYVSNAPAADLQKFVGIVSQMAFSVISIGNAVN